MGIKQPIATAPRDGRRVTVLWTDRDGQENETIAQYRSPERLKALGGNVEDGDAGWWAFIDGDTQKRIDPHSWSSPGGEDEE